MLKLFNYMKKSLFLLPAVLMFMVGCDEDKLEIPQKGVVAYETFYKDDADCEAAINKVYIDTQKNFAFMPNINGYNYGPYFGVTNYQSDDIYLSGSGASDAVPEREFHDFRYGTDNVVVTGAYTAFYRSIHKCNLVINNFTAEKVGTLTQTMKRAVAEARVMRAFDHLLLAIYWGTPPIVTEVLTGDAQPENAASQDAVLDFVTSEIDLALPDLEERKNVNDAAGSYKITKGFALGVKGKALLWKKDYNGVKTVLKQVINSGKYSLNPDFSQLLHYPGRGSCESVFEFNIVDNADMNADELQNRTNCNSQHTFSWRTEYFFGMKDSLVLGSNGWGWINPTGEFAKALIANDGMNSARRKASIVTYDELTTDPKWRSTFYEIETDTSHKAMGYKIGDLLVGLRAGKIYHACEGYFNYKNCVHPAQGDVQPGKNNRKLMNLPVMRYAEILLMYAEACARTNDNDGLQYLQAIQNRAGSAHVSQTLTLDEVKNEKRFELYMEGCRSADLIRWGDTQSLKVQDYNVPSFVSDDKGNVKVDNSEADYYKKNYGTKLGFKDGKDELLPFPLDVTNLNQGITQNPGW